MRPEAVKMHGTGNEFYVLDRRDATGGDLAALAREWCGRSNGHGADGLLVIERSPDSRAFATMRVINADGSEAEMCGNGVRCVARYLAERGAPERFVLATLAGPIAVEVLEGGDAFRARASIGRPAVGESATLVTAGKTFRYRPVSLGNPHAVVFVDDLREVELERDGAAIASHGVFPNGTNAHFVQVLGEHDLRVLHYERGVGVTRSCGTGAVASAAVAILEGRARSPVTVHVPGGTLLVEWRAGESATMTGPADYSAAPLRA